MMASVSRLTTSFYKVWVWVQPVWQIQTPNLPFRPPWWVAATQRHVPGKDPKIVHFSALVFEGFSSKMDLQKIGVAESNWDLSGNGGDYPKNIPHQNWGKLHFGWLWAWSCSNGLNIRKKPWIPQPSTPQHLSFGRRFNSSLCDDILALHGLISLSDCQAVKIVLKIQRSILHGQIQVDLYVNLWQSGPRWYLPGIVVVPYHLK